MFPGKIKVALFCSLELNLQDINNKRRTEIDTLNFQIVEIAKALNKEGSVHEPQLLVELVKIKSQFTT